MTDPKRTPILTSRQAHFAKLVLRGSSQADAWRAAYRKPHVSAQRAAEEGCKVAAKPSVQAEMNRIRQKSDAHTLLSYHDQLSLLAGFAQKAKKGKGPGYISAGTRAVDVYAKIAGTMAPQRVEHTGADGQPIQTASTVLTATLSPREKARALREQLAAKAPVLPPSQAAP